MQEAVKADEVMRLRVKISKPEIAGSVTDGTLQVIPIVGGIFSGGKIRGTVVSGTDATQRISISSAKARFGPLTRQKGES